MIKRFGKKCGHRAFRDALRVVATCALSILFACAKTQPHSDAPGLRVGDVLGADEAEAAFARADAPREFRFPADHGAHPGFRSEWWYLTLALEDTDGREFGVQFTIFRQASFAGGDRTDPWRNGQAYLGHVAVTDVRAGAHREAERLSRGHPALAGAWAGESSTAHNGGLNPSGPIEFASRLPASIAKALIDHALADEIGGYVIWLEGWHLSGFGGRWRLVADAHDFAVTIDLTPTKPIIFQGDQGLSAKGPGQASYYYSVPRLQASGSLRIDGVAYKVQGNGWLDREWSTSVLGSHQVGWDWFALMLDNGEDIMAFRLRRDDGTRDPHDHGVVLDAAGRARYLGIDDFELSPLDYWRDERGTAWPIRWTLALDEHQWEIAAPVHNQRMDTLLTYWEGLVHVRNQQGERVGRGYMELTGY